MRSRSVLAVVVALAGLAAGAALAAVATDPKELLLRSSDVPAGAKRVSFGGTSGAIRIPRTVHGKAAYVAYSFKNGARRESVGNAVGALGSTGDAHDVFLDLKEKAAKGGGFHRLSVPSYGDEQVALGIANRAVSGGILLARSGPVLWEVIVSDFPGFTESQLRGELEKYAARAKKRAAP